MVPWLAYRLNRGQSTCGWQDQLPALEGKPFRRDTAEFGETVMYPEVGTKGVHKFNLRWERGTWLGIQSESGEAIVDTCDDCVTARDIRRLGSIAERWDALSASSVQGTTWEPMLGRADRSRHILVRMPEDGTAPSKPTEGEQNMSSTCVLESASWT